MTCILTTVLYLIPKSRSPYYIATGFDLSGVRSNTFLERTAANETVCSLYSSITHIHLAKSLYSLLLYGPKSSHTPSHTYLLVVIFFLLNNIHQKVKDISPLNSFFNIFLLQRSTFVMLREGPTS